MSKNYALKADKRDRAGKGIARALRRDKKTPAVIYGDKKEPVTIALDENTINVEYLKGHMYTSLCELDLEGQKHLVLARDVQLHPVTDNVMHVDFLRVNQKTKIAVMVPVHFINEEESPGMRERGTLNVTRHEVEMMCSAMDLPDYIEVDLTGKEHGDTVRISDAKLPDGMNPVIERNFTIAVLMAPKTAAQAEAEENAEAAEDAAAAGAEATAEGGEEKKDEGGSE